MEFETFSEEILSLPKEEIDKILFIENHPEYKNYLLVSCTDPSFQEFFTDIIGPYRELSFWKISLFMERAYNYQFRVIFLEDPSHLLHDLSHLHDPYPYKLNVNLKQFQLEGFNFLRNKRAQILDWSTGTGKSVYAVAEANYLLNSNKVEKVLCVAKHGNRINWARRFKEVADLQSEIIGLYWNEEKGQYVEHSGNKEHKKTLREVQYLTNKILIVNYEKFRIDEKELTVALGGKRVYFIWDEMPTKLKSHTTDVWRGTRRVIRSCKESYHSCLTATAIENIPEDIYNCVRLMDETALDKTLREFRSRYVKEWSPFAPGKVKIWDTTKLQELGIRLAHMTHRANKYTDASIASQFPSEHWDDIIIEMSKEDRNLYNAIEDDIRSIFWDGSIGNNTILSRIQALQIVCNNPSALINARGEIAQAITNKRVPTDKNCEKLKQLKELLSQIDGKVVLFSSFNALGSQMLSSYLTKWGYNHVVYDGTLHQKQAAEDKFQNDPNIKVFVSSDQGSDSINLDAGSVVINYDLPWKHSTLVQRVNRINRITSKNKGIDNVTYFTLINANTIEERKRLILEIKKRYQESVFGGAIEEQSHALSKEDLWYILTGEKV